MVALTLRNPTTSLSFTAVFAGLGLRIGAGWGPALGLVLGVMLGSALWWVVLTSIVSVIRERLTPAITHGIGFASGVALMGLGVVAAVLALSS